MFQLEHVTLLHYPFLKSQYGLAITLCTGTHECGIGSSVHTITVDHVPLYQGTWLKGLQVG